MSLGNCLPERDDTHMETFWQRLILVVAVALGVVVGASIAGMLAALAVGRPPLLVMATVAREIKVWAIAAAIGGTFSTLEILESGIFQGQIFGLVRQLVVILASFVGAQVGSWLVKMLTGGPAQL